MATAPKKRIMREFELHEISAVTAPAQKGARMVIMKSADAPAGDGGEGADDDAAASRRPGELAKLSEAELHELITKGRLRLTSTDAGHSHLIEIDEVATAKGGGTTYSGYMGGNDTGYHTHPFTVEKDGTITIGGALGHTHYVVPIAKAAGDPATTGEEEAMTPEQIAQLNLAVALGTMTDAQKGHFAKLSGDARDAFVAADFAKREDIIKAAQPAPVKKGGEDDDDDEVAYTAKDGTVYRKSAGAGIIALAKSIDGQMSQVSVIVAKGEQAEAERIANELMGHIGLPIAEKVAHAKGILALPETLRNAQLETLKKHGELTAPLFKSFGTLTGQNGEAIEKAEDKITKLAKQIAEDEKITPAAAYIKACRSPAGQEAYRESKVTAH